MAYTAILAGTYNNIQTVKAKSSIGDNLGQNIVKPRATGEQGCPIANPTGSCNTFNPNGKGLGSTVSGAAGPSFGETVSGAAKNAGHLCP